MRITWHVRVKCKWEKCNPFFLAAEGSSTHLRILGASCCSAAKARESRDKQRCDTWSVAHSIPPLQKWFIHWDIPALIFSSQLPSPNHSYFEPSLFFLLNINTWIMLQFPGLILDSSHNRRAGHGLANVRLISIIIKKLAEITVTRRLADGDWLNGD